jgi:hypothetical protein
MMRNNREIVYLLVGSVIGLLVGIRGSSDFISFLGSILGGVIGGLFTLIGVQKTIELQIKKERRDSLPTKIVNIEEMIDELDAFIKDFNRIRDIIYNWGDNDSLQKLVGDKSPQEVLREKFLFVFETRYKELKKLMLKKGAAIDVETFDCANEYFKGIKGWYNGLIDIIPDNDSELPITFYQLVQEFYYKSGKLHTMLKEKSKYYKNEIN